MTSKATQGTEQVVKIYSIKCSWAWLFYSSILIPDVQLSIIITLLAKHPVQNHWICQNPWAWFTVIKNLCSAKLRGIKLCGVFLSINANLIRPLGEFEVRKWFLCLLYHAAPSWCLHVLYLQEDLLSECSYWLKGRLFGMKLITGRGLLFISTGLLNKDNFNQKFQSITSDVKMMPIHDLYLDWTVYYTSIK